MAKVGMLSDGGGDPRLNSIDGRMADYVAPQFRRLHDANVMFEEYLHYAELAREEENGTRGTAQNAKKGIMSTIFPSKSSKRDDLDIPGTHGGPREKNKEILDTNLSDPNARANVSDDEWANASRALRLATWPAMFYLITTDILGPFTLPYAMATTGWGPGIALYTVFGALAGYSGYLLWKMFLSLDSYQFPVKTFGDLGYRIYGPWARHGINFLQSVQLLCNVGVIVIQNGLSLSQVSKFKLCYVICCLVWAIAGFFIGQIRTLQKFGWIANSAIWINVLIIFLTMGVAANTAPNYAAISASAGYSITGGGGPLIDQLADGSYPPVQTSSGLPNPADFSAAVGGLMQAVYSYGGSMLFTEFMSEMRRPYDFIKAMWGAQLFIYCFYMFYGCFLYGYQGQYVVNPSYQGMSPYGWQAATNVLAMITSLIAAGLYGNIGIKVLYNNVLVELFNAPPLTSRSAKFLWIAIVPVYWTVAFIIAAAIPNFSGLTGVVAAFCILHFTYTFPPLLYTGFLAQKDAIQEGEGFDPATGRVVRHDSGFKRALRGAKKHWYYHLWLWVYGLGALVTSGLGAYAAIEGLIVAFSASNVTAFTCHSPLDG